LVKDLVGLNKKVYLSSWFRFDYVIVVDCVAKLLFELPFLLLVFDLTLLRKKLLPSFIRGVWEWTMLPVDGNDCWLLSVVSKSAG